MPEHSIPTTITLVDRKIFNCLETRSGDVTRCRPGPGPSRQRLRHRAEALEGGFRSNIARCWRQRLYRVAPLERGHVWQSCRCLQRRLLLRGSASRQVGFGRASPRAALPDHGTRQSCRWSVLRARGSPPAPRAARDDYGGFVFGSAVLADAGGDQAAPAAAGWFFGRAALRRRQGLPAMTAAASCSARRCSPMPATRQHACCWLVLRARGSPPAPRAGRDDCSGFVFGSAVLADGRAALFSAGMTRREPGGLV